MLSIRTNTQHATRNILFLTSIFLVLFFSACTTTEDQPSPLFPSPTPRSVAATPTLADPLREVTAADPATTGEPLGEAPAPVAQTTGESLVTESETEANQTAADEPPPPTSTPTSTITPIPDLPAADLYPSGRTAYHDGQFDVAAEIFRKALADPAIDPPLESDILYWLGRTEIQNDNVPAAVDAFRQQLTSAVPNDDTHFQLGELNLAASNCPVAIQEYTLYLEANPDLGAYIWPRIANCTATSAEIISALENALTSQSHYLVEVGIRQRLATLYRENENYAAAIAQYAAIRDLAQTEQTKGSMSYQIGATHILSGSLESGYAAYQTAVNQYPRAYDSYLGLVELVGAEQPVDLYQRGVVNYHAGTYVPAINAFTSYISTTTTYISDTHLYLAWTYEQIADFNASLAEFDNYLALDPTNPTIIATYYEEKAAVQTRSISVAQAITTLDEFVENHPDNPRAPWAAWRTAVLADRFLGDAPQAAVRYITFATNYPTDENAAEALYLAGVLLYQQGATEEAISAWEQGADSNGQFRSASLTWLMLTLPEADVAAYTAQATTLTGSNYHTRRALDVANGRPPYPPPTTVSFTYDEAAERQAAEAWLAQQLGLESDSASGNLSTTLANDGRLIRGTKLWQIGALDEGKRELETLRLAYADDALASYQLALHFRDLGLYRSSILAAVSTMVATNISVFEAPKFIGRLAYPTYYANWVIPLADQYDYDPLLHFSLIRQESLFEGFATSTAIAQGLSQIIPDTGVFVAQRLQWPDYTNDDLFQPWINLTFGAYYFDLQLETFDGNTAAALAAYNAGPGNALNWYNTAPNSHDLYLETVNFNETRLYIRNIYIWHAVYRHLYSQE